MEGDHKNRATSSDGTSIAFDRSGEGPPVIVVDGATCDRAMTRPLAEQLAQPFTVINYDRRGRGDSGDTAPYAVEREIEDLGALIAEAGGTASVYSHSSGAGLVLHAAAHGLLIAKLVLHEPPYAPDGDEERRISRDYAENLKTILAEDRRGDAVELFMTTVGMPQGMVGQIRHDPTWVGLEEIAPTLAYDSEIMGDISRGGTIPLELVGRVTVPTLVLCGGESPAWMIEVGRQIADALPDGGTVCWRARNTSWLPSCSHRCLRSSSPTETATDPERRAERSRNDRRRSPGRLRAGERPRNVLRDPRRRGTADPAAREKANG